MAKPVISGRAFFGTAFAVVTLVADKPVRILQLGVFSGLCVLGPVSSHTQLSLDGKKANDEVWVIICKKKERKKEKEVRGDAER